MSQLDVRRAERAKDRLWSRFESARRFLYAGIIGLIPTAWGWYLAITFFVAQTYEDRYYRSIVGFFWLLAVVTIFFGGMAVIAACQMTDWHDDYVIAKNKYEDELDEETERLLK